MKISIATLVMLAGAGVCAPAMATTYARPDDQSIVRAKVVHYGDLNVNTIAGADQLYRRISFAAQEACGEVGVPAFVTVARSYQECRQKAMEQAVAKIDSPELTAIYDRFFPSNPLASASATRRGSRSVG